MKAIGNYLIEQDPLGKGQFGIVYRCHEKQNHAIHHAVKIIQKKTLSPRLLENLKNEINILSKIRSPYIIKLLDIQRTENNFYLFMELCNGGDLEQLKEIRGGRFSELEARIILQQLVRGFKEIYEHQVMHRDMKLANILVHFPDRPFDLIGGTPSLAKDARKAQMEELLRNIDLTRPGQLEVKIADLGFAKEVNVDSMTDTVCGTPLVMAPEVLNGKRYNHKADVWSLGVVFFEMLVGFTPFTGRDKPDLKRNLESGNYGIPKELKLSLQGLDFLNSCLQFNHDQRLSWKELIKHPYISEDPYSESQRALSESQAPLHLSYSEAHGQFVEQGFFEQQREYGYAMPQRHLNEKNAIMLSVKDPSKFREAYENAIARTFAKKLKPEAQLKLPPAAPVEEMRDEDVSGLHHSIYKAFKDVPDVVLPKEERKHEDPVPEPKGAGEVFVFDTKNPQVPPQDEL